MTNGTPYDRPPLKSEGPRRARFLVPAIVLVVIAIGAVVVAATSNPNTLNAPVDTSNLRVGPSVPALDARGWINTPPLTKASLTGKVVLYDFWTYSCINCVRTFPYVRAWYDRYRADGLVVVGVHSPEFDFEKVHSNVASAVQRLHVTWPVALDDNMKIWSAFGNRYWPADYVADRTGRLRYTHFGEGDYTNTENVLRTLLAVPASAPRANPQHPESTAAATVNPETYLGTEQTTADVSGGVHTYPDPGALAAPEVALRGTWDGEAERVTAVQAGASIVIGVHASEVNLVLAKQGPAPIDAVVQFDGKPVPANMRGAAITVDAHGNTVVKVDAPDMYRLTLTPTVQDYVLTITASQPGLEAYDFTFG